MRKRKATTEALLERLYQTLQRANRRMSTDDLAREVGVSKSKVYLLVGLLRRLMESVDSTTISSERGVGYRIAGRVGDVVDEQQQAIDTLMEIVKSQERMFSQAARARDLFPKLNRVALQDPDYIELLSISVGAQAIAEAAMEWQDRLKQKAGDIAKKKLLEAREEAKAPSKAFGLKSFQELLQAARADDDGNDDDIE
jgi:AcrR family transcriptional regulator